ncbi:hypothetical protein ES705_07247 [subsurface metagenome]
MKYISKAMKIDPYDFMLNSLILFQETQLDLSIYQFINIFKKM